MIGVGGREIIVVGLKRVGFKGIGIFLEMRGVVFR